MKAKRLGPIGRDVVGLFISGQSMGKISDEMGLDRGRVRRILQSTAARQILDQAKQIWTLELEALEGKVVEGIRNGMDSVDPGVNLRAIDVWNKMQGRYGVKVQMSVSAEDIVGKLMAGEEG